MPEKDELKLSRLLSRMEGESEAVFPWGNAEIQIKYINYSAGGKGSPDSLLILRVTFPVLGKRVTLQGPILIEAEKAGIEAAIEDLQKFCERSMKGTLEGGARSFLEIPMVVATERPKLSQRTKTIPLKATFRIIDTMI